MNENCFILVIRQVTCQSGVPVTSEKVFTNINELDSVSLDHGYTLNIRQDTNNSFVLTFINSAFDINLEFRLAGYSPVIIDLPIQNGTFRVAIYLRSRPCNSCNINSCCSKLCSCKSLYRGRFN